MVNFTSFVQVLCIPFRSVHSETLGVVGVELLFSRFCPVVGALVGEPEEDACG
jgi:hypothetical protein